MSDVGIKNTPFRLNQGNFIVLVLLHLFFNDLYLNSQESTLVK